MEMLRSSEFHETQYEDTAEAGDVLFLQLAAVESQAVPVLKHLCVEADKLIFHPSRSRVSPKVSAMARDEHIRTMYIRVRQLFGRTYITEIGVNQVGGDILSMP